MCICLQYGLCYAECWCRHTYTFWCPSESCLDPVSLYGVVCSLSLSSISCFTLPGPSQIHSLLYLVRLVFLLGAWNRTLAFREQKSIPAVLKFWYFCCDTALLGSSHWIRNQQREFVFFAGWSIIVFRCELAIMFGIMLLITLAYGRLPVWRCCLWILFTGVFSLGKYATI